MIVTAPGSGAEAIPFLKVCRVSVRCSTLMILYAKLSNVMSKTHLSTRRSQRLSPFRPLCPRPLSEPRYPHPTVAADQLQAFLPDGFTRTCRSL